MYTPDNWVILKITYETETLYKILAGTSGGYLDGDSWRMNSGIKSVTEEGDYILFHGFSGSTYRCHKDSETMRMNNLYVFNRLQKRFGKDVTRINYEDYKKL